MHQNGNRNCIRWQRIDSLWGSALNQKKLQEKFIKDDLKHIDEILEGKKKMNRLKAAKYAHHIFFNVLIDWKNIEDPSDYDDDVAVFNDYCIPLESKGIK